jgi:MFS family permease
MAGVPALHDAARTEVDVLPAIVTTLLAGKVVAIFGTQASLWGSLVLAGLGLPLMLSSRLAQVLAGMVLVGVGAFFAPACTTGFVGRAAITNRGVASGTYLACYFAGGLVGSAVLGQLFDRFGWPACLIGENLRTKKSLAEKWLRCLARLFKTDAQTNTRRRRAPGS